MSQRNAPPLPPNGSKQTGSEDDAAGESPSHDVSFADPPEIMTMPGVPQNMPPVTVTPGQPRGRQFGKVATPTAPFMPAHLAHQLQAQQLARNPNPQPPAPPPPSAYTPAPPHAGSGSMSGGPSGGGMSGSPMGGSGMGGSGSSGMGPPGATPLPPNAYPGSSSSGMQPVAIRTDVATGNRPAAVHIVRSRAYSFVLDPRGMPIEIGSGRSAKAFLGEERWIESKTDFRRDVVIKMLQKGISEEDHMRFEMEKELLERVQGHPAIVHLYASGENEDFEFIPASIRDKVECEFVILERLEMSLEERLKGSRSKGKRDDLLAVEMRERIFRVLDYMIPIASAIEYAHLIRNVSHRDLKPANILIGLPNPNLRGSTLDVRLADFNVAKIVDEDVNFSLTQMKSVPGTLFFQSPEQETNIIELLVNVQQGSAEVEYFEDFYIQIEKNDTFALFNRGQQYPIMYADRTKKKVVLGMPYRDTSETNVRAKVQKSVGRPADIYSIGALFYYLISGAYANPKTLYDNFHKFIEYERADESNTIQAYLEHEYSVINSLRAPKSDQGAEVAPADRFFSYKHYLDGNGELIDPHVMMIIAKCMIRNKPDSYCQAHDVETRGISDVVQDMIDLYTLFGVHPSARPQNLGRLGRSAGKGVLSRTFARVGNRLRWLWLTFIARFRRRR